MVDSGLCLSLEGKVRIIKINRPERKNAIHLPMYEKLAEVLNSDAQNDKVVLTIITSDGDVFCSGTDLKDGMDHDHDKLSKSFQNLVENFINYPKLLIAVVNGLAVGLGVTILGLCDVVYASERATFSTPFVNLSLCAEGGSSFLFPFILGRSKASEMLLLGQTLTADEAYKFGFVSKVIPHEKLKEFTESLKKYGKLPVNAIKLNKRLIMRNFRNIITECCKRESEQLKECINSEEFLNAVIQFMNKKSKL